MKRLIAISVVIFMLYFGFSIIQEWIDVCNVVGNGICSESGKYFFSIILGTILSVTTALSIVIIYHKYK
jgi:uncharacterized membrane protein